MKFLIILTSFVVSFVPLMAYAQMGLAQNKENERRPNIVLIVSDDQHWQDYGFMGHSVIQTPNIDRLAEEGLIYTKGYVPSSLCCPSLASLIIGQYPHQHRITSNDPPVPPGMDQGNFYRSEEYQQGREVMRESMKQAPALPRLLEKQGYLSLQTGKWWPCDYHSGGFTHGMTVRGDRHGDDGLQIGRETMKPIHDFLDLAAKEGKPFFIWYAPMLPHQPHDAAERFLAKYRDKTDSIHEARYWANVEWFDETCGELLDELSRRHLQDNTVVVYLADNGWIQERNDPNYASKSKQSQYDGGLRTPIIIRWPEKVRPNRDDLHRVSSVDIAPTLLKIAGLQKLENQPGIDLLDENAVAERKAIFGECFFHNFVDMNDPDTSLRYRWMIENDWKLIVPSPQEGGMIELYNLANDPHENHNLATENPNRVKTMIPPLDEFYHPKENRE